MAEILHQLEINETFFFHFVLFVVTFLVLKKIYFLPFLGLIQERNEKTHEDTRRALEITKEGIDAHEKYSQKILSARTVARENYESAIQVARSQEARLTQEAQLKAKSETKRALEKVESQKKQLKEELRGEVEKLTQQVCEKLHPRNG